MRSHQNYVVNAPRSFKVEWGTKDVYYFSGEDPLGAVVWQQILAKQILYDQEWDIDKQPQEVDDQLIEDQRIQLVVEQQLDQETEGLIDQQAGIITHWNFRSLVKFIKALLKELGRGYVIYKIVHFICGK